MDYPICQNVHNIIGNPAWNSISHNAMQCNAFLYPHMPECHPAHALTSPFPAVTTLDAAHEHLHLYLPSPHTHNPLVLRLAGGRCLRVFPAWLHMTMLVVIDLQGPKFTVPITGELRNICLP